MKVLNRKIFLLYAFAVLFAVLWSGCKEKKKAHYITKLTVAAGGCFGNCAFAAVEIDSSLSFKYYGGEFAGRKGYYLGHISKGYWDTLNVELKKLDVETMDTLYEDAVDGLEEEFVLNTEGGKKKHIVARGGSMPGVLSKFINNTLQHYKNIELTKVKDTLDFETKIQYPVLIQHDEARLFPPPTMSQ